MSTVLKEIIKVEKDDKTVLRAEVSEYKGFRYLDLREWSKDPESDNRWKPTKKGITLRLDVFELLIAALLKSKEEICEILAENDKK